jgi:hypothetical protein
MKTSAAILHASLMLPASLPGYGLWQEGELQLPSGLWIDSKDRVYLADSYNQRVQIFQYINAKHSAGGQR